MEQEVPLYMHFDVLFIFHLSVSACHTNVSEFRMAGEVVISQLDEPKTEKKTPLFIKENFKIFKVQLTTPLWLFLRIIFSSSARKKGVLYKKHTFIILHHHMCNKV